MRLVEGGGTVCGQTGPALVCADDNIMFFILRWPRNMCLTGLSPPALHTVFKVSSPCRRVRRSLRRQKACTRGLTDYCTVTCGRSVLQRPSRAHRCHCAPCR